MIQRSCRWCGFAYDASISYEGHQRKTAIFGRYRSWCTVQHRAKSYRVHRKQLQRQEQLRQRYRTLDQLGQLRFDLGGAA